MAGDTKLQFWNLHWNTSQWPSHLKSLNISIHFNSEKDFWSRTHAIRTSTKAIEHVQLCSIVWNFTCMSQEPQSTVTRIWKLTPGAAWRKACRSPPVWEQRGHGRITTVDPTINREDFSLREENRGTKPACFLGFLEGFKKNPNRIPNLQNLSFPLKTPRKYLLFSNSNLLPPVSTSFSPSCYAELHMRVGKKAIYLI